MIKRIFIRYAIKGEKNKRSIRRNNSRICVELYLRKAWEILII